MYVFIIIELSSLISVVQLDGTFKLVMEEIELYKFLKELKQ